MLRHVDHVFGGDLMGAADGQIELCWTHPETGALSEAQWFRTDQLEELVEAAAKINRQPGVNVYIGQALRHPDSPPFGRGKDKDFYALTTLYADIDDDVTATASITYRNRG